MVRYQFQTFGRLRPPDEQSKFDLDSTISYQSDFQNLTIYLPKNSKAGFVNNKKQAHHFKFSRFFDQHTTQQQVFEGVARPLIDSWIEGYNGTIFAYGQTGSGKTHTMSGTDTWKQRGIIPRVFTYLFQALQHQTNLQFNIYVTYVQVYNENAYDLLQATHAEQPMEKWTKIQLYQDTNGNLHMKNMSVHQIYSEQDGIDLLMMGNFIRHVSTTPMNLASSRSHCVFTLAFECREIGSQIVRSSKLYLVDLAGSQRIAKSQVHGQTLKQARHINLSLTYLQQVIIALHTRQKDQRTHVPYRNSFMTTILRDSLGGNCKTIMIATMNSDFEQLQETLSTAKFAMRCSKVTAEVSVNQHLDINLAYQRLKQENQRLKKQVVQGENINSGVLQRGDVELCKRQVAMFLSREENPQLIIRTEAQAYRCLQLFSQAMFIKEEEFVEELENQRRNYQQMRELQVTGGKYLMILLSSVGMHGVIVCKVYTDIFAVIFQISVGKFKAGYQIVLGVSVFIITVLEIFLAEKYFKRQGLGRSAARIEEEVGSNDSRIAKQVLNTAYYFLQQEAIFHAIGWMNISGILAVSISTVFVLTWTSAQITFLSSLVIMNTLNTLIVIFKLNQFQLV